MLTLYSNESVLKEKNFGLDLLAGNTEIIFKLLLYNHYIIATKHAIFLYVLNAILYYIIILTLLV